MLNLFFLVPAPGKQRLSLPIHASIKNNQRKIIPVSTSYPPLSAKVYIMDKYAHLYLEDTDSGCVQPISLPQPRHPPLQIPLFPRHHPDS